MKRILIILLFISCNCIAQTKILFLDFGGANSQHDSDVYHSFVQGYNSSGGVFNPANSYHLQSGVSQETIDTALKYNCKIIIRSSNAMTGTIPIARLNYPNVLIFMPAGSNSHTQVYNGTLPALIITGAGDTANFTGYNIEFWDVDPIFGNASSFSNGYIAGKIAYIIDTKNCGIWEARYRARISTNKNLTNENGFGKINVTNALNYNDFIPEDPYLIEDTIGITLSAILFSDSIKLEWNYHNGTNVEYRIFYNDSLYTTKPYSTYIYSLPIHRFEYPLHKFQIVSYINGIEKKSNIITFRFSRYGIF